MPETRARDLANLAGAGATSSTVAYHETSRSFTLPAGVGETNQVISSDGDGTTQWKTTLSAPEVTSVTSDKGVNEYDSDGDDGAVIVVNGSSFGSDASALTVEMSTDNFVTTVQTSTISILTNGIQIQATFNGTETNYNTINAGETVKVKVTKSALQSPQSATLSGTVTGDPTFSTTSATASTHTGTLAATSLGSYGGQVAGGGNDSNTKFLLNFDRAGGTDIEDSSNIGGDGHKVTPQNNAIIKASPFGDGKTAMYFDGNDYLTIGASSDFDLTRTSTFTIDFWFYRTSTNGYQRIVSQDTGASQNGWALTTGSAGQFEFGKDDTTKFVSTTDTPLNVWNYVRVTGDGTTLRFYINGKLDNSAAASGFTNWEQEDKGVLIGKRPNSTYEIDGGYLDELRIINGTAVSTGDSHEVPTSRLTAITNTKLLIHSNRTDEGNTTFTDSSSDSPANNTAHTITRTGAIHSKLHGGIAPAMSWPASNKKTGSCGAYFDGTGDYLDITDSADFNFGTGAMTIDFWFYCTSVTNTTQNLWSGWYSGTSNHSIYIQKDSSANSFSLRWYQEYSSATSHWYTADGAIQLNTWYHVGVTRSGTTLKCFINGVDTSITIANEIASTEALGDNTTHNIGRRGDDNNYFIGYIDSFRIQKGVAQTFTASPTQIYGTYRTLDVGTIQLNATAGTGGGALDYAEFSGGTALSAHGLSISPSGAITGTLSGLNDNSNSNKFYIRARANADDNRVTTLGGNTLYTNITQNDNTAPVLFNARRWVGTGVARSITGLGFKPDFVWTKERGPDADYHQLQDSVRGPDYMLWANTDDDDNNVTNRLTSFDSDGFSISTDGGINGDGNRFIGWAWKAGGAPSSSALSLSGGIGAGTIADNATGVSDVTSITQSVNQNSGFSITKYTGGGGNTASFPHNLGGTPDFIIIKNLDEDRSWVVWHKNLTNATNSDNDVYNLWLDLNAQQYNATSGQHDHGAIAGPTGTGSSAVINVRKSGQADIGGVNQNTKKYICYAWKAVTGVSAFGTYEGTGSSGWTSGNNGGAQDIGFKPRFTMVKNIDSSASWEIHDSFREGSDTKTIGLWADGDWAEIDNSIYTIVYDNNGFKFTSASTSNNQNQSGSTYIYIAFA